MGLDLITELEKEYVTKAASIRLDDSGANLTLESACKQKGLRIKFEFTASDTLKQNGQVERKFAMLYGCMCDTLNCIDEDKMSVLWTEVTETATDLDNQNSFQKFSGDKKECFVTSSALKRFGGKVIVANRTKFEAKMKDHGIKCLWLRYIENRFADTYRLYNPKTRAIILSRDVKIFRTR